MPLMDVLRFAIPIALAIWLTVRAIRAQKDNEQLCRRLETLEVELLRLKREREPARPVEPAPAPQPIIVPRPVPPPVAPQPSGFATPPPIPPQIRPALARLYSTPQASPEDYV